MWLGILFIVAIVLHFLLTLYADKQRAKIIEREAALKMHVKYAEFMTPPPGWGIRVLIPPDAFDAKKVIKKTKTKNVKRRRK